MTTKIIKEFRGDSILPEIRKHYDRDSKFCYNHLVLAAKNIELLPFLVLKITKEDSITTIEILNERTNERIK